MKGKPIEAGCLALIIKSRTNPENLGKVVRVLRLWTKNSYKHKPEGIAYELWGRCSPMAGTAYNRTTQADGDEC